MKRENVVTGAFQSGPQFAINSTTKANKGNQLAVLDPLFIRFLHAMVANNCCTFKIEFT